MLQYKINGERLKKLMENKNIKAYKLSDELEQEGYSISTNTITNYMKEKTPPKNLEYVKAIANYFNVSTDYLLGEAPTPTNDISIKNFCNKYGLTEKSLSSLERINQMKKDFNGEFTTIDTVNRLLEEIEEKNFMCIIQYIDYFLNLKINPNKELVIGLDDDICIWDKTKSNRIMGRKNINNEILIKSILIEIEDLLVNERNIIQKEGEKNEHKRKSKK